MKFMFSVLKYLAIGIRLGIGILILDQLYFPERQAAGTAL